MQRSNHAKILLIHSPLVNPSVPPLAPAQVAGCLSSSPVQIEHYDANLDFFDTQVMSVDSCGKPDHDPDGIMKTEKFYDPDTYCREIRRIDEQLANYNADLFLNHCKKRLDRKMETRNPDLIIFFASAPHQTSTVLVLADYCKRHRPDVPFLMMGDLPIAADEQSAAEAMIPEKGYAELFAFFSGLGIDIEPDWSAAPDFSGLPLDRYYTPSLVLPFSAASLQAPAESMPSEQAAQIIQTQAASYGAKDFICVGRALTLADMRELSDAVSRVEPQVSLSVSVTLGRGGASPGDESVRMPCVKVIRWQTPGTLRTYPAAMFLESAKSGIWNHVDIVDLDTGGLNAEFGNQLISNPNIAHSWDVNPAGASSLHCFRESAETPMSYGKVRPLPGHPFWHFLKDPVYLMLYVKRPGIKALMRMRTREREGSVYTLGRRLDYQFVRPSELPPGYLDDICRMVEAGGSVGSQWVRYNLEKAFLIGYVIEEGVIVGNSSLKHPRSEYIQAVNEQSGLDLSRHLERGYTSVRPEYRGLGVGTKLLEGLTERAGDRKIFSVIAEDNLATKTIAIRNRTKQVASFYSERMGKQLGIWMPEWMVAGESDQPAQTKENR